MKFNFRVRPCELAAIDSVAKETGLELAEAIRFLATDPKAEKCRRVLRDRLARLPEITEKRVQITVTFSKSEWACVKKEKIKKQTLAETLRRILGLRAISTWFLRAARARARRGNRPVLSPEIAADFLNYMHARARVLNSMGKNVS